MVTSLSDEFFFALPEGLEGDTRFPAEKNGPIIFTHQESFS